VIGIERELVGGECPYWGCVPSKMMIRGANLLMEGRRTSGIAGDAEVRPDWGPVAQRIRQEATDNWDDKIAVDRFVSKGGEFVRGSGRFFGPARVSAANREFAASRAIVLNVGTSPVIPPIPGLAEVPNLLPMEEPQAGQLLAETFAGEGIEVRTGSRAESVEKEGDGIAVALASGERLVAERLLVAVSRRPNRADLGLEEAGVGVKDGYIQVDDHLRAAPGVWAVGDATGHGAFTHVSKYQARLATDDILGRPSETADYRALPRVTFTDPEVGAAGLTEKQARDQGIAVQTGSGNQASSARGWIHKAGNQGFIKLVEDADRWGAGGCYRDEPGWRRDPVHAGAIHARVPTRTLRSMIYAYPTFHPGMEDALAALGA
jgi:pyruvate/2-oxoglutarate dehydrogenase complex dihydrolipoamide dehydrogenase (E3) component